MLIALDVLSEAPARATGTGTYTEGFLSAIADVVAGKHRVTLLATPANSAYFRQRWGQSFGVEVLPLAGRSRAFRVLSQLAFVPLLARRKGFDVINFLGTTGAFGAGCPTVQHVKTFHHVEWPESLDPWARVFRRTLMAPSARYADLVIANSEYNRRQAVEAFGVHAGRVRLVAEAVDHRLFSPPTAEDGAAETLARFDLRGPYFLLVSNLWRYKNTHTVVRAFAAAKRSLPKGFQLVIVGGSPAPPYYQELLQEVQALGLTESVRFLGHCADRRLIRDLYVRATAHLQCSLSETFGLTVLEAMACGTPVICSNTTALPEVAGDAALLVDPRRPDEIAAAMRAVTDDPSLTRGLVERGIARAALFTWERTARDTVAVHEEAAACSPVATDAKLP